MVAVMAQQKAEGRCAKSGNREKYMHSGHALEVESTRLFFVNWL